MSDKEKKWEIVRPGDYEGTLASAVVEPFKNGTGRKLSMRFEVLDGSEKRLVFHDIPIKHTSKKYMEGGNRGADLLLKAIGVENGLEGVDNDKNAIMDYIGSKLIVSIGVQEGTEYTDSEGNTKVGNDRNVVRTFKSL